MDSDIAVALIGAIGVGGTIVGTFAGMVLGARIQARGGHDQAQAARDAATTTATATARQAMAERRWAILAEYLRSAAALHESANRLYALSADVRIAGSLITVDGPALEADVEERRHALLYAYAEAELGAPAEMRSLVSDLQDRTFSHVEQSIRGRDLISAHTVLRDLAAAQGHDSSAGRAHLAVTTPSAPHPVDDTTQEDLARWRLEATRALEDVRELTVEQRRLLAYLPDEDQTLIVIEAGDRYTEAWDALVTAARRTLGTDPT
ncbi:hypothetical protein ABT390_38640 [Streptomyces aurantiacus]|uniref:Uncharacterized protein n=1 Tax=Streptomyces aurantiacus JA 4570 TaxID=1286094 RepID=S3ZTY9_9ACTN|nr:hypothetical protein [Streptomyces aurantiacus]EPH46633.1 hypothetical protein STRAU_0297 [Streptomyces aurantiacus JA 4570]